MEKYDVIVIGGGLLGCFTLRSLTRYRLTAALLEAREDVCTGISRANTAIVYSGVDTKPGTLKSTMCVRAAQGFGRLCAELGVRYSPCGSLMVSFGPNGEETLRWKMSQGLANGVRGLRLLGRDEVLSLEPNLSPTVTSGLYTPEAGTVIPWELGLAAAENAVMNGGALHLNNAVAAITKTDSGYRLVTENGTEYFARGVINCGGLSADTVLEMVSPPAVRIFPAGGDYYILDTKTAGYIRHVIFHEPEEKGKGLTLVPTVDGNILLGPSRVHADQKDESFPTSEEGLCWLRALVDTVIPELPMEHVIRSFGAMRPNPFWVHLDPVSGILVREDKGISSFILHETADNPGFLSLIGVKTPGLTCSDELGRHAAARMAEQLGVTALNDSFSPNRPEPLRLETLPTNERAEFIARKSEYGRIVCRCRHISEGEIVDSIHRTPGAVTVDGVKRRTGAGSGRCQGGFCTQRIIEILSRELGVAPEMIRKDRPGSVIFGGQTHENM